MKRKSLITMLATLSLVAVVGVGSTLAYLSDTTTEVTNTFTLGNVDIKLDEDDITKDDETRTEEGNEYKDIQPGDVLTKDPTIHIETGSSECYAFIQVTGLDALLDLKGKNAVGEEVAAFSLDDAAFNGWVPVLGYGDDEEGTKNVYDGVYRYNETLKDEEGKRDTTPLFNSITFNSDLAEYIGDGVPSIDNVVVTGYAVQAKNLDEAGAFDALANNFTSVAEPGIE